MAFPKTVCKASETGEYRMVSFSDLPLSNIRTTTSHSERASDITPGRRRVGVKGSLTIEAALVLPIVVFVLLGVSYFFRVMAVTLLREKSHCR